MRSHDVITPEFNPSSRLQLHRRGAAFIRWTSDYPVGVVAKGSRFDFVGGSFKQSVHIFGLVAGMC
jgi:hypothetical protein